MSLNDSMFAGFVSMPTMPVANHLFKVPGH
jgi:hypothetical protein